MPAGEPELLETLAGTLSKGVCVIDTDLPIDQNQMKAWGILTAKPYVIVANVGEDDLTKGSVQLDNLKAWAEKGARRWCPSAPGSNWRHRNSKMTNGENSSIPLASSGPEPRCSSAPVTTCSTSSPSIPRWDRLRAWTLKKGGTAYEAAGLIHTDIQNGFIKADVISLDDFLSRGGIHGARDAGLILTEGREFVLRDKDVLVIHFR
ncbi:MAG: DUF933 domain-containing protein [Desulfobacterales bacterium]|nr:DUF933 domain-containing protein [Desulfobacterales bacterium]